MAKPNKTPTQSGGAGGNQSSGGQAGMGGGAAEKPFGYARQKDLTILVAALAANPNIYPGENEGALIMRAERLLTAIEGK